MIKFNSTPAQTLEVSRTILKALTSTLYGESGVDMYPIVRDLSESGLDPDLVALNVALLMQRPDLAMLPAGDKTTRCSRENVPEGSRFGQSIIVYEYQGYSLLRDRVHFVCREFSVYNCENTAHPNTIKVCDSKEGFMSLEEWRNKSLLVPQILIDNLNCEGIYITLTDRV